MGHYYKMLKHYKEKGMFSEQKMWESVECLDELLEEMEEDCPDKFWEFMRDQHEIFCGPHFDEKFAKWQVEHMHHKGSDGKEYKGEHWSMEDTDSVMAQYKSKLPAGTTSADFYVALNANYHDKCRLFKSWFAEKYEEKIIEDAIDFYFMDEDAPEGKVWHYMIAMDE